MEGTKHEKFHCGVSSPPRPSDEPAPSGAAIPLAVCSKCSWRNAGSDGLCGACRLGNLSKSRRRYPEPSSELLEELRVAYVGNTRQVAANLDRVARKYEWSKAHLKYEARKRGWRTQAERRNWSKSDEAYLQERIGRVSLAYIAKKLGRSLTAVTVHANRLGLSLRVADGYNVSTLCEVFGLHRGRIKSWINRGLLGQPHGHGGHGGEVWFTEENVLRFIRNYPREYDLGRVDQLWFKGMVFGSGAAYDADL